MLNSIRHMGHLKNSRLLLYFPFSLFLLYSDLYSNSVVLWLWASGFKGCRLVSRNIAAMFGSPLGSGRSCRIPTLKGRNLFIAKKDAISKHSICEQNRVLRGVTSRLPDIGSIISFNTNKNILLNSLSDLSLAKTDHPMSKTQTSGRPHLRHRA